MKNILGWAWWTGCGTPSLLCSALPFPPLLQLKGIFAETHQVPAVSCPLCPFRWLRLPTVCVFCCTVARVPIVETPCCHTLRVPNLVWKVTPFPASVKWLFDLSLNASRQLPLPWSISIGVVEVWLGHQLVVLFGDFRRWGLARTRMSLKVGFEASSPFLFTLSFVLVAEMWAPSFLPECYACGLLPCFPVTMDSYPSDTISSNTLFLTYLLDWCV